VKPFTVLLPEPLLETIKAKGKENHRAVGPQIRYALELLYGKEEGIKKPSKAATKDGCTQAS
jgi:hypothetical protein